MGGVLKYLSFQGRTNRKRYWLKRYWLTSLSLFGIFLLSMAVTSGVAGLLPFGGILLLPLVVGYFVAAFATATRRLHDRNIWAFVELGCLKGTAGPNKYGDDPLEPQVQEVFA
jgi:uncharacterized membrane protein YhaH (DUF805 family)